MVKVKLQIKCRSFQIVLKSMTISVMIGNYRQSYMSFLEHAQLQVEFFKVS